MSTGTNDSELRKNIAKLTVDIKKLAEVPYKEFTQFLIPEFFMKRLIKYIQDSNNQAIQHTLDKLLSEMGEKKTLPIKDIFGDGTAERELHIAEHKSFNKGYNIAYQEFVELINKVKGVGCEDLF